MQFAKPLHYDRPSPQNRPPRPNDRRAAQDWRSHHDTAVLSLPQNSSRKAPSALSWLTTKAAAEFTQHAANAFPNLLLAILSWTVAEVITACAVYAEAMYPISPPEDVSPDSRDVAPAATVQHKNLNSPRNSKPGLNVISGGIRGDDRRNELVVFNPIRPNLVAVTGTITIVRPKRTRRILLGWCVSFAVLIAAGGSKMRAARGQRRAMIEVSKLDDRTLRDIGISRCDIHEIVRRGSPLE